LKQRAQAHRPRRPARFDATADGGSPLSLKRRARRRAVM